MDKYEKNEKKGPRLAFLDFEHQREVLFQGCVTDPLQTMTAIHFGLKWLVSVRQDAMSTVLNVYPHLNLRVYVDDIKIHDRGTNQEVLEAVPNVVSKLRSVVQEAELKFSLTVGGKEGKNKLTASNNFLE